MCNYYKPDGVIDMPNFDGTGRRKRGPVIGRSLGHCIICNNECEYRTNPGGFPVKEETPLYNLRGTYVIAIHHRK